MPSKPGLFEKYAKALRAEAEKTAGFFTAAQARTAGYADSVHGYHLEKGDWVRVQRGIYQLAEFPEPPRPDLIIFSIWSRDRQGEPQGVYSHATAREIHGFDKFNGGPVHMTVPKSFRKNAKTPDGLILHKEDLTETAWEQHEGYRVLRLEFCGKAPSRPPHPFDAVIQRGED